MDNKLILGLLAFALISSGCADSNTPSNPSGGQNGIKVTGFSISDKTLTPNQSAIVEAEVTNYNPAPTTINSENITIYNTGQLKVEEGSKSCSPDEIGASRKGLNPSIGCTWNVQAPKQSFVEGFERKPLSFKMRVNYSSTLENPKPLKINFQQLDDINKRNPRTLSFGNGDVSMKLETETPSAISTNQSVSLTASKQGPGTLVGNLSISCSPPGIPEDCSIEKDPIRGEVQHSFNVESQSTGVRNLFISTSYKYEKTPNLDIEVVNNQ